MRLVRFLNTLKSVKKNSVSWFFNPLPSLVIQGLIVYTSQMHSTKLANDSWGTKTAYQWSLRLHNNNFSQNKSLMSSNFDILPW